jgi:hypothetical protein
VVEGLTTEGTSAATHLTPIVTTAGDIKVFAGPREDPFFFDLVGFNRSIAAGANLFTGVDAFKGKNINAIVVEFPVNMVFPSGSCTLRPTPPFFTRAVSGRSLNLLRSPPLNQICAVSGIPQRVTLSETWYKSSSAAVQG